MLVHVRPETGNAIKVRSLDDHDRPPRRFATGRLCAESSCGTRLSIYNDSEYCSLHHQGVKPANSRQKGQVTFGAPLMSLRA